MFRAEGPNRSERLNRGVAGFLALIGGYVNSIGFISLGVFTSHVTGNIGRFAAETTAGRPLSGAFAFVLVAAFFVGAFTASLVLQSSRPAQTSRRYGIALAGEALVLAAFIALGGQIAVEAPLLSFAMGMQNSLVTRLSGAIVRTTHLTGVVTDLGIETARWFAWILRRDERPSTAKVALLGTIALAFIVGAIGGAFAAPRLGPNAIWVAVLMLVVASISAFSARPAPA